MDKNDKLIASVFDNAVTALGLMTNKLSDSIKAPMSDEQLRDQFAGMTIQTLLSQDRKSPYDVLATESYKVADALLKARKETNS